MSSELQFVRVNMISVNQINNKNIQLFEDFIIKLPFYIGDGHFVFLWHDSSLFPWLFRNYFVLTLPYHIPRGFYKSNCIKCQSIKCNKISGKAFFSTLILCAENEFVKLTSYSSLAREVFLHT